MQNKSEKIQGKLQYIITTLLDKIVLPVENLSLDLTRNSNKTVILIIILRDICILYIIKAELAEFH